MGTFCEKHAKRRPKRRPKRRNFDDKQEKAGRLKTTCFIVVLEVWEVQEGVNLRLKRGVNLRLKKGA